MARQSGDRPLGRARPRRRQRHRGEQRKAFRDAYLALESRIKISSPCLSTSSTAWRSTKCRGNRPPRGLSGGVAMTWVTEISRRRATPALGTYNRGIAVGPSTTSRALRRVPASSDQDSAPWCSPEAAGGGYCRLRSVHFPATRRPCHRGIGESSVTVAAIVAGRGHGRTVLAAFLGGGAGCRAPPEHVGSRVFSKNVAEAVPC